MIHEWYDNRIAEHNENYFSSSECEACELEKDDSFPSTGMKFDKGKARFDLILPEFELALAKVLSLGAGKYNDENYKNVEAKKYYAALCRHLNAFHGGELHDTESGLPHLAHVAANTMFLLYHSTKK